MEKIYLCGITAQPPHRDIQKTALGATESVVWEYEEDTTDLILRLNEDGVETFAIEQVKNSVFLDEFLPKKGVKIALVMGMK